MEVSCKLYGELGEINVNVNLCNGWLNHTSGTDSHINADIQLFHVAVKPPNCRLKLNKMSQPFNTFLQSSLL